MMNDLEHATDRLSPGYGRRVSRHPVIFTFNGRQETLYLPDTEQATRYGRRLQAEAMHRALSTAGRWVAARVRGASPGSGPTAASTPSRVFQRRVSA